MMAVLIPPDRFPLWWEAGAARMPAELDSSFSMLAEGEPGPARRGADSTFPSREGGWGVKFWQAAHTVRKNARPCLR